MKNLLQKFPSRGFYLIAIVFSYILAFALTSNAAEDGYVIIVNKQNPVTVGDIKMSHVRNVFILNKTKWKGGSRSKPIFPGKGTPSYDYLLKNVLKMSESKLNRHWLQLKQRSGTSVPPSILSEPAMVKYVGNSEGAIAIVSANAELPNSVKVVVNLK